MNITRQKVVAVFRDGSTESGRLLCELRMVQNNVVQCSSLLASDKQISAGLSKALLKRIDSIHALAAKCAEDPAFPALLQRHLN